MKHVFTSLYLLLVCLCCFPALLLSEDQHDFNYESTTFNDPFVRVHWVSVPLQLLTEGYSLQLAFADSQFEKKQTLSDILSLVEVEERDGVLAAINASFDGSSEFFDGSPRGPVISNAIALFSSTRDPTHPSFGITSAGQPWLAHVSLSLGLELENDSFQGQDLVTVGLNAPRKRGDAFLATIPRFRSSSWDGFVTFELQASDPFSTHGTPSGILLGHKLLLEFKDAAVSGVESVRIDGNFALVVPPGHVLVSQLRRARSEKQRLKVQVMATAGESKGSCAPKQERLDAESSFLTLGAGGLLLLENELGVELTQYVQRSSGVRAPRSALCFGEKYLRFVAVDGVRPGLWRTLLSFLPGEDSRGMSIRQLATFMKDALGCHCAIELDGGKSSTLYFQGRRVNSPATGSEHEVTTALVVVPPAS